MEFSHPPFQILPSHSGQVPCRSTSNKRGDTISASEADSGENYSQTGTICESYSPGDKKRWVLPPIVNLKPLNCFIWKFTSRWKDGGCSDLLQPADWMCCIDLKDVHADNEPVTSEAMIDAK